MLSGDWSSDVCSSDLSKNVGIYSADNSIIAVNALAPCIRHNFHFPSQHSSHSGFNSINLLHLSGSVSPRACAAYFFFRCILLCSKKLFQCRKYQHIFLRKGNNNLEIIKRRENVMSIKGSQSISCNVNSCAFNQERKCTLKAIVVAPCPHRSEERRVGKECRSRWSPYH